MYINVNLFQHIIIFLMHDLVCFILFSLEFVIRIFKQVSNNIQVFFMHEEGEGPTKWIAGKHLNYVIFSFCHICVTGHMMSLTGEEELGARGWQADIMDRNSIERRSEDGSTGTLQESPIAGDGEWRHGHEGSRDVLGQNKRLARLLRLEQECMDASATLGRAIAEEYQRAGIRSITQDSEGPPIPSPCPDTPVPGAYREHGIPDGEARSVRFSQIQEDQTAGSGRVPNVVSVVGPFVLAGMEGGEQDMDFTDTVGGILETHLEEDARPQRLNMIQAGRTFTPIRGNHPWQDGSGISKVDQNLATSTPDPGVSGALVTGPSTLRWSPSVVLQKERATVVIQKERGEQTLGKGIDAVGEVRGSRSGGASHGPLPSRPSGLGALSHAYRQDQGSQRDQRQDQGSQRDQRQDQGSQRDQRQDQGSQRQYQGSLWHQGQEQGFQREQRQDQGSRRDPRQDQESQREQKQDQGSGRDPRQDQGSIWDQRHDQGSIREQRQEQGSLWNQRQEQGSPRDQRQELGCLSYPRPSRGSVEEPSPMEGSGRQSSAGVGTKDGVTFCTPVSSNTQAKVRDRKTKKIPNYDGKTSWIDYYSQFEIAARLNAWSIEEKALELATSLDGTAREILSDMSAEEYLDYENLVDKLTLRFEPKDQREIYLAQLKGRRRKKQETIPELLQDIKKLTRRAFPSADETTRHQMAISSFISALDNERLELSVYQKDPKTVEEAAKAAMSIETFLVTRGSSAKVTPAFVRQQVLEEPAKVTPAFVCQQVLEKPKKESQPGMTSDMDHLLEKITGLVSQINSTKPVARNIEDITCYYCKEKGHYQDKCTVRGQDHSQGVHKPRSYQGKRNEVPKENQGTKQGKGNS